METVNRSAVASGWGEGGRNGQSTEGLRAVGLVCITAQWWKHGIHNICSDHRVCSTEVHPKVNYGLELTRMRQCRFTHRNKCTTLVPPLTCGQKTDADGQLPATQGLPWPNLQSLLQQQGQPLPNHLTVTPTGPCACLGAQSFQSTF